MIRVLWTSQRISLVSVYFNNMELVWLGGEGG